MTKKGEVKPTRMINPDSEQRTPTSADIFETKTSNVPMPISWAGAGLEYGMLVTRRDKGDDWAYIRKLWKEMLMVVWQGLRCQSVLIMRLCLGLVDRF